MPSGIKRKIQNKQRRCQYPGSGVGEDNSLHSPVTRNEEEDPEYSGDADTAAGQEHGDQHIAGSAKCSGEDLDEDEGRIGRDNDLHDPYTDRKNLCIGGKERQQEFSKEKIHEC